MPYIKQGTRAFLDYGLEKVSLQVITEGDLNYAITRLLDSYIKNHGGTRYARINEVVGVLECAKLEFYRRIAAPYEDVKREENGDVYLT